jgi:hypothetical protein
VLYGRQLDRAKSSISLHNFNHPHAHRDRINPTAAGQYNLLVYLPEWTLGLARVKSSLQCCCEFVKLPRACDPLILTLVKMPAKMGCEMSESKFVKSGAMMDGIFVAPEVNQPRVY